MIETAEELATADFEDIELADVRLKRGDPAEYIGGRILDRWNGDLTLRYRGHEHTVTNVEEWRLVRYQPVAGPLEKQMIRGEWDESV